MKKSPQRVRKVRKITYVFWGDIPHVTVPKKTELFFIWRDEVPFQFTLPAKRRK
jgi:hypothetical protein